jgi:hypothetical protein
MTSAFQCRYGCGTWLHVNHSIKTNTGKLIPLQENEMRHECHLSPFYRYKNNGRHRAIAVQKEAIARIDEYQIVEDLRNQIVNTNSRLWNYELELVVREKDRT